MEGSQYLAGAANHSRRPPLATGRPHPTHLLLALFLLLTPTAHPQGCTQCRDNTAATPPSTQRAYRHAIVLLALTATGIFTGSVLLLRRHR